jgi:hypothetical protein
MKHTIKVMTMKGDTPFSYDPEVETEFKAAQEHFNQLKGNGMTMFSVDPDTKETKLVDELFKTDVQVIGIPQIKGG